MNAQPREFIRANTFTSITLERLPVIGMADLEPVFVTACRDLEADSVLQSVYVGSWGELYANMLITLGYDGREVLLLAFEYLPPVEDLRHLQDRLRSLSCTVVSGMYTLRPSGCQACLARKADSAAVTRVEANLPPVELWPGRDGCYLYLSDPTFVSLCKGTESTVIWDAGGEQRLVFKPRLYGPDVVFHCRQNSRLVLCHHRQQSLTIAEAPATEQRWAFSYTSHSEVQFQVHREPVPPS